MNANYYKITAWGRSYNPENWFYDPGYLINRIYYLTRGTVYYQDRIRLKPGHLYIFRADPEFRVSQHPEDPVDHVYFDFLLYQTTLTQPYVDIDLNQGHDMLRRLLEMMMTDFELLGTPWQVAEAYFELLTYHLREYLNFGEEFSPPTVHALRYINTCDLSQLSISDMAQQMNVSNAHLIRSFKKDIGITPHKYVAMLKSDLAVKQIRQGVPSSQIAENLGFSSVAAFYTFFKKETHCRLSDFRK